MVSDWTSLSSPSFNLDVKFTKESTYRLCILRIWNTWSDSIFTIHPLILSECLCRVIYEGIAFEFINLTISKESPKTMSLVIPNFCSCFIPCRRAKAFALLLEFVPSPHPNVSFLLPSGFRITPPYLSPLGSENIHPIWATQNTKLFDVLF